MLIFIFVCHNLMSRGLVAICIFRLKHVCQGRTWHLMTICSRKGLAAGVLQSALSTCHSPTVRPGCYQQDLYYCKWHGVVARPCGHLGWHFHVKISISLWPWRRCGLHWKSQPGLRQVDDVHWSAKWCIARTWWCWDRQLDRNFCRFLLKRTEMFITRSNCDPVFIVQSQSESVHCFQAWKTIHTYIYTPYFLYFLVSSMLSTY